MIGEFTNYCNYYYKLSRRLEKQEKHFRQLLANALPYTGQTNLSELDDIIKCNREVQAIRDEANKTSDQILETERTIFKIMDYFEISPNTVLQGIIPEKLEYNIWADENGKLSIEKTKSLQREVLPENIIMIRFSDSVYDDMDDDDE